MSLTAKMPPVDRERKKLGQWPRRKKSCDDTPTASVQASDLGYAFNRTWTPAANASSGTMTSRLLKSVELRPLARSRNAMGERNDRGFSRFSKSKSVGLIDLSVHLLFLF